MMETFVLKFLIWLYGWRKRLDHFRNSTFPALRPDCICPSGSFDDAIVPFDERLQENTIIFDGVDESNPTSSATTLKPQLLTPTTEYIVQHAVSFRPRDPSLQVIV